jgi:hypothetical protein
MWAIEVVFIKKHMCPLMASLTWMRGLAIKPSRFLEKIIILMRANRKLLHLGPQNMKMTIKFFCDKNPLHQLNVKFYYITS